MLQLNSSLKILYRTKHICTCNIIPWKKYHLLHGLQSTFKKVNIPLLFPISSPSPYSIIMEGVKWYLTNSHSFGIINSCSLLGRGLEVRGVNDQSNVFLVPLSDIFFVKTWHCLSCNRATSSEMTTIPLTS